MKNQIRYLTSAAMMLSAAAVMVMATGCPAQTPRNARVTTAITTGDANKVLLDTLAAKADVAIADIEHFYLTITQIVLDRQGGGQEIIFTGALEVDLLDLLNVSEVVSNAAVAPGTYTKIRLSIANPRLVLKSDPNVELMNIHLTANSRLFISQTFVVPPDQTSLILLDFGGIKLVQLGNGDYNLTPQLAVDLNIVSADVLLTGQILVINGTSLTIQLTDGTIAVAANGAVVFLPGDTDTPTGVLADLAVGQTVDIAGTLLVDGSVVANTIVILP